MVEKTDMYADSRRLQGSWVAGLPEFEPDPALWQRIQNARHRQVVRRRWRLAGAASAVVAALTVSLALLFPGTDGMEMASTEMATSQQRSSALEQDWLATFPVSAQTRTDPKLERIDRNLQRAYDDMSSSQELIPLWQQRNQAMQEQIERGPVRSITRI